MKCRNFKISLQDYIDGNLSYGEMQEMDEHMQNCESCAEIYENELSIDSKLSDIFGEKHLNDNDFTQDVFSQIDENYYKSNFSHIKFSIKNHAALLTFASALIVCILVVIPYIKSPAFKSFLSYFKNHQTNTEQPKPVEKDNNTKTEDKNKTNIDDDKNKDTSSKNTPFRILVGHQKASGYFINVYEPLTNKNIATLNFTWLENNINDPYEIIGDRVYYTDASAGDEREHDRGYMTFDGKITKLDFLKQYSSNLYSYFVSSDNKKIAWITYSVNKNDVPKTYTLYVANMDGTNTKKLWSRNYGAYRLPLFSLLRWNNEKSNIYLYEDLLYNYNKGDLENLYEIDSETGEEALISKEDINLGTSEFYDYLKSQDGTFTAHFSEKHTQLIVKNNKTSKEQCYPVAIGGDSYASDAQFSPDGKYIVYKVSLFKTNISDDYRYVLLNLSTGKSKILDI